MKTKSALFVSVLAFLGTASHASVLGDLAAVIPDRTFVKMPVNASLKGVGMDVSLLYYADSGVWDPIKQEIAYVGGPGTCCASPAVYKRLDYKLSSDTWTIATTPFVGSGHGYDANALDPKTGDHYFAYFNDKQIKKWTGTAWETLPAHGLNSECCVSLSWFPEINGGKGGLLLSVGLGMTAWFNGTSWTSLPKASAPWGEYEGFSEHNPVLKQVWMGSGSGGERVHYTMDAAFKLTRLKDAPISLKNNNSLKSVDPVSGKYIVYSMDNQSWWEFDSQKDVWTQMSDLVAKPNLGEESLFHVPIPTYGVIMFFKQDGGTRETYLYRHAQGVGPTAVDRNPSMTIAPLLSAVTDPTRGLITLSVSAASPGTLQIRDINGGLVNRWSSVSSAPLSWNVANLPAGVYLADFRNGSTTVSKSIVLGH